MVHRELHVVTGAFGYSGRQIAEALLTAGKRVRTLTSHPNRPDPFGGRVQVVPCRFDDPAAMHSALRGATVLYNTYWVRFEHGETTFEHAVDNSCTLIRAAADAGVERMVHTSITHPSLDSPLPYFHGKAEVERCLIQSGLSYAILRPAVFFGGRDVLINNIAWMLRRLPVVGISGDGSYQLQPIHIADFAALAADCGAHRKNETIDAVGPEIYSFEALVEVVARHVKSDALIVHLPWWTISAAAHVLGWFVRDVILTRDEIKGLSSNLLVSEQVPTGTTRLSEWLAANADHLGTGYTSELARHYR